MYTKRKVGASALETRSGCSSAGAGGRPGQAVRDKANKATNTCSSREADGSRRALAGAEESTSTTAMEHRLIIVISVLAVLVPPELRLLL